MYTDFCILCGKEALTIDDLCADCHMKNFWDSLEPVAANEPMSINDVDQDEKFNTP